MESTEKHKEAVIRILKTILKGISSGDIKFLGIIESDDPKYDSNGVIPQPRESHIKTISFQYQEKP